MATKKEATTRPADADITAAEAAAVDNPPVQAPEPPASDAAAQIAAMLAEAKDILFSARAQADDIISKAEAQREMTISISDKKPKPVSDDVRDIWAANRDKQASCIKTVLPFDADNYGQPVYACVNGDRYMIRRGEEVEIPGYIKDVLAKSARQDAATAVLVNRMSDTFTAATKEMIG